jgi:hypothetical protein
MSNEDIKRELISKGFAIRELPNTRHVPIKTYYNKQGAPLTLPADPISLKTYLGKGFTLTDPNGQGQVLNKE